MLGDAVKMHLAVAVALFNYLRPREWPLFKLNRIYKMKSLFQPRAGYSARAQLINIWQDFYHDYLTIERYAECHHITVEQARALIDLACKVNDSIHPEA